MHSGIFTRITHQYLTLFIFKKEIIVWNNNQEKKPANIGRIFKANQALVGKPPKS